MVKLVVEKAVVYCEDCKHLKNASLKSSYTTSPSMYYCDSPANKESKDGWLRKQSLTFGPKLYPWQKNAENNCKDFELLYKGNDVA